MANEDLHKATTQEYPASPHNVSQKKKLPRWLIKKYIKDSSLETVIVASVVPYSALGDIAADLTALLHALH